MCSIENLSDYGVTVLVGSLDFSCNPCPVGTYSVLSGSSNGSVGAANNSACLTCPSGAQCTSAGTVQATQDHWGASDAAGVATFVLCPPGYCNSAVDISAQSPSVQSPQAVVQNACAGHRMGRLCSECGPGFVDALGCTDCRAVTHCAQDKAEVWPLIVIALLGSAVIQLVFVSGVWAKTKKSPSATVKLAVFFFQVG